MIHGEQVSLNAQGTTIDGVGRCSLPVEPTPPTPSTPEPATTPKPVVATSTTEKKTPAVSSLPSTGSGPSHDGTSDRFLPVAIGSVILLAGAFAVRIRERDAA